MTNSHSSEAKSNPEQEGAFQRLEKFLASRRGARKPVPDLEEFERELHAVVAAVECEAISEELARFDIDVPMVVVDGVTHRKVLRCEETYLSSSGPLRVERSLYSSREQGEPAICPMELRAGVIEGRWTPLAARHAIWAVANLTPGEAEELFSMLGGMKPSRSSLDRLPKQMSARWEEARDKFEEELRSAERVPPEAAAVAASLDGVLVPMKDGQRQQKRAEGAKSGKRVKGPAGYEEVGCATLSLYDAEGNRLRTVRMARMPETKKATLKSILTAELSAIRVLRPDLELIKLADGARDNWEYLSKELPKGREVVDFYHAVEHLNAALIAAYGEISPVKSVQLERLRHVLRHDPDGVEKVIRSLRHLKTKHPRSEKIATELAYFRRNRKRMRYAKTADDNLPIGSGVTEAACKTLATQRLKRSGMRWREGGWRPGDTHISGADPERSVRPGMVAPRSNLRERRRMPRERSGVPRYPPRNYAV